MDIFKLQLLCLFLLAFFMGMILGRSLNAFICRIIKEKTPQKSLHTEAVEDSCQQTMMQRLKASGFFLYGVVIPGLVLNGHVASYPVVNETAVRVQAGMMTVLAGFALSCSQLAQYYVPIKVISVIFFIDFFAKVIIGLKYSPFYTIASFVVRNKKAEYVGAVQKHFAWSIGLSLATLMVYLQFIADIRGGITTAICAICVIFMGLEWLFGLCVGCRLYYGLISLGIIKNPDVAPACPNGACPVRINNKNLREI